MDCTPLPTLLAVFTLGVLATIAALWIWYEYGPDRKSDRLPDHWKPPK